MRICPFCKKEITVKDDTCPHCHRVLVERVRTQTTGSSHSTSKETNTSSYKKFKNSFKLPTNKLKNIKWNDIKKYAPIAILLLVIILVSSQRGKNIPVPVSVIPNETNTTTKLNSITPSQTKDPKSYSSLTNGTVLSQKIYYFNGLGKLKIDNGTSLDAIAKLVDTSTNKSVYTVYIKANSILNISEIRDGKYKLFFNLGNDWNKEIKAFSVNSSYEVFEESFDFTTDDSGSEYTQYSTFSVTLNPVIGGQAKTDSINATEFGGY